MAILAYLILLFWLSGSGRNKELLEQFIFSPLAWYNWDLNMWSFDHEPSALATELSHYLFIVYK